MPVFEAVLIVHVIAGVLSLVLGLAALVCRKGGVLHVRFGTWFWKAMIAMCVTGIALAVMRPKMAFLFIGLLGLYLVQTGRNALTRQGGVVDGQTRIWFAVVSCCLIAGLTLSAVALTGGNDVLGSSSALYLGASFDAAIFCVLDYRLLRAGGATGVARTLDHLWRMIAAMFFATFAIFVGNGESFPGWFTSLGLNYVPLALLLAVLAYWIGRVGDWKWVAINWRRMT